MEYVGERSMAEGLTCFLDRSIGCQPEGHHARARQQLLTQPVFRDGQACAYYYGRPAPL